MTRKSSLLRLAGIAALALATPALAAAPSPELIARVSAAIDADAARLTAIFKDLHQHPEIAFTETRTSAIVAKELKALGFEVTTGVGKTGVVGVFRNGPGPTLWFRADMDSNSVLEATGLPWAATQPQRLADGSEIPVMHACGHDAHTTWLMGLAKAMKTLKNDWSGTLVVYAQPAEEVGLGAQAMVKDGLHSRGFPKPDFALGSHAVPLAVGVAVNAPGVRMAGTDQLDVTFTGIGGHGSTPELAIDPVVMASQAVVAYQTVVSRAIDPQSPSVLTVGAVIAGRDNNVIPASAELRLNLRWFDQKTRDTMLKRIDEINTGIVLGAGLGEDKVPVREMKGSAGPLRNDPRLVDAVTPALKTLLGEGKLLTQFPSVMGSEDFQEAFADTGTPYTFLLIGIAEPARFAAAKAAGRPFPFANHNNDFVVDLPAIPLGTQINTVAALALLAK
jgi:hippurate hydrolase